ncbi:MAG: hypothetical protein KDI61_04860 [Alphaproteobacteria bacterium]|nr:hypothetical protein [Alphaproteobacteria bacterium]MCB1839578.1 hypothetical protein [Alphaproteobacteria bacterium]
MAKPLLVYHLTTAGQDDETLRSLFEHHAQTIGPQWVPHAGQRNGFFVNSSRRRTENIGITPPDDLDEELTKPRIGAPVIATVACDFSEGWDIDYEDNPDVAKMAFFRFAQTFQDAPADRIVLSDGTKIRAIRIVNDEDRDGLEFDVLGPHDPAQQTLFMSWDEPMDTARLIELKALPPDQLEARVSEMNREPRISEYALLQALRDYLVETHGETYLRHEEQVIRDAISRTERRADRNEDEQPQGISLKYSGTEPLKIVRMEILTPRKGWQTINEPPAGSGEPDHNPPEHA